MDAYIEEVSDEGTADATIYDIEAEQRTSDRNALPRRNRFYSGIIDVQTLRSGADYRQMRNLIVLTILSYDPFGKGDMWYEASTRLVSHPDIPYDDGVRRIYLYGAGKINREFLSHVGITDGKRIRDMLHYIRNSTKENVINSEIERVNTLVERIKRREEVSISYMQSWEINAVIKREAQEQGYAEGHAQGISEGRAEGFTQGDTQRLISMIQRKLEKNLDADTIADHLESDIATVEGVIAAIRLCPAGSGADIVYRTMQKETADIR